MKLLQKQIVRHLIDSGQQTSYGLSKLIKKSIPSIEYALLELVDIGVIVAIQENGKTTYDIHPFFRDVKAKEKIGKKIVDILKIIEQTGEPPSLKGYIAILEIIIDTIDMQNSF